MACAIGGEEGSSSPSRMVPPMELSREPPCAPQMPSPRMLWFCGPGCGTHAVPLNMVSSRHEGRENKGHWWRKRKRSFGHGRRVLCGQGKWSWQGTPMRQQHASLLFENEVQFWQHACLYRLMRTLYVLIFFNSSRSVIMVSTETFGRASIISTKALTVLDFIGIPAMARMDRSSATTCHLSSSGCSSIVRYFESCLNDEIRSLPS